MTDRSASDERKIAREADERKRARKTEAAAVSAPNTEVDPKVAAALYEAQEVELAAQEKAREAEKLRARSAQTAFGTPQMIHASSPDNLLEGREVAVRTAQVDKDGNIKVSEVD